MYTKIKIAMRPGIKMVYMEKRILIENHSKLINTTPFFWFHECNDLVVCSMFAKCFVASVVAVVLYSRAIAWLFVIARSIVRFRSFLTSRSVRRMGRISSWSMRRMGGKEFVRASRHQPARSYVWYVLDNGVAGRRVNVMGRCSP